MRDLNEELAVNGNLPLKAFLLGRDLWGPHSSFAILAIQEKFTLLNLENRLENV